MAFRIALNGSSRLALAALLLAAPLTAPLIGAAPAEAATKKTVKKAATKKPVASKAAAKRVCTAKKVKGKTVRSCKAVKVAAAEPVAQTAPVVVVTKAEVPVVQTIAAPPQPAPLPPPPPQVSGPPAAAFVWIDMADSLADAIGNAPPDYTFRHDGIDSWAWTTRGGETLIVEPGRAGVVHNYFRGRSSAPYLVRTADYSYAFDGPNLVHTYDWRGDLFTGNVRWDQKREAERLQARGRALMSAALRSRSWSGDAALTWYSLFHSGNYDWNGYSGWRGDWRGDWRRHPDWRSFEYEQSGRMPPRYLEDERRRRKDAAWRYDRWRRDGARGAPPPTANPVVPNPAPVTQTPPPPAPPAPPPAPRPAETTPPPPTQVVPPPPPPAPRPVPRPGWQGPPPQPTPAPAPPPEPVQPPRMSDPVPGDEPQRMRPPRVRPQPLPAVETPAPPPEPVIERVAPPPPEPVHVAPPPPPPPPPAPPVAQPPSVRSDPIDTQTP